MASLGLLGETQAHSLAIKRQLIPQQVACVKISGEDCSAKAGDQPLDRELGDLPAKTFEQVVVVLKQFELAVPE